MKTKLIGLILVITLTSGCKTLRNLDKSTWTTEEKVISKLGNQIWMQSYNDNWD